ncbi:MAG: aminotransferase class V-fold PLP-dependent enzyme, partial [Ilumatobacter sp.]|nr:aminotransferase class V-fold PLP-dependent enzyme [Ilumatobacter sp.]
GMVVKTLPFDPHTYEFDLAQLDALITERTRFAALNMASNLLGTINPIQQMCARLREAGAITYVDAVQYAPHGPIDVQALGCDFLVSSAYKWYGPHQGVLWGREELLQTLPVWKLEAAGNDSPNRWETGTQSHEGQAGCIGAVEYLQWVGQEFGAEFRSAAPAGCTERTADLHSAMRAMAAYEESLSERLITGLRAIDGVEIRGITNLERLAHRVPTVSFTRPGMDNTAVARHLADHNVYVWSGHNYALPVVDALGIREQGVVRVGPTHYNTLDEVDTLLALVADVAAAH